MEKVCVLQLNIGMFVVMKEVGDVMGVFVGYDYDNDYVVMWKNIFLVYGCFIGGNMEYNYLFNGVCVIVFNEGIWMFEIWICQKGGVVDFIFYLFDYVKDDWRKC